MMLRSNKVSVLIITWVFLMSQWMTLSTRDYSFATCTDSGTFRVIFDISIDKCIEECHGRKRCVAIMFHRGLNECKLKESMEFNTSITDGPLCVFVNMTDVDRGTLGQCSENDCAETDRCQSNSKGFRCVKTECLTPNNVSNAYLHSNKYAIGTKNRYKCNNDYFWVGDDPSITCTTDGSWTQITFKCHPRFYENAEVTAVEGDYLTQGTVIHFKCRPGFQKASAYAISVMNSQGDWEPSVVPCCHENSTTFLADSCIAVYNGSTVGSFAGKFQYCKDTGGKMKWLSGDYAKHLFESSEYLFLMNNNRKEAFAQDYNLTLCLAGNMEDDAIANLSSLSYDVLVQQVLSKDLNGGSCDSARFWSPGQPDGGYGENCIAFKRDDFKMHDISCNVSVGHNIGFVCDYSLPQIHV